MNVKILFSNQELSKFVPFALLLVRVVMGVAFMLHGWGKIQNPFAWMGPDAAIPGFFQFLAALSEFGGGLALVIGLLTRLSLLGIASTMFVAVYFHAVVRGDPFVGREGSYEPALFYLCVAILLFVLGPGKLSLDNKIFKK